MTIIASIALYLIAAFLACAIGIQAEKLQRGEFKESHTIFVLCAFVVIFGLAACLQVFGR